MENIKPGKEGNFERRRQGYSDFFEEGSVNSDNSPYDVLSLLHYGPRDFAKNTEEDVITFLHGLPDETWPAPVPEDPLSVIDQVPALHHAPSCVPSYRWSWQWPTGVS